MSKKKQIISVRCFMGKCAECRGQLGVEGQPAATCQHACHTPPTPAEHVAQAKRKKVEL